MSILHSAPFPRLRSAYMRAIARAWTDHDYRERLTAPKWGNEPRGVLPMLEHEYSFEFPFDVKLLISDEKSPRWEPIPLGGWLGFADAFHLWLPKRPNDPRHCAAALARYCAEFPSMLGAATNDGAEAPPAFGEFGVVTSRLLALVWDKPNFAEQLYASDDARSLIQDVLDSMVPWNFALRFSEHIAPCTADDHYWRDFPRTIIEVNLPQLPKETALAPVALAAYNNTGAQYPFTC